MAIRVTLKVSRRDKRYLEVALSEEQLGLCREKFWENYIVGSGTLDLKRASDILHSTVVQQFTRDQSVVIYHAIASVSLFVGGTYWYKARHPKSEPHARIRTFVAEDGTILCPKCDCLLADAEAYHVKPHEFSTMLKNPHFICYQCNSHVIVSSRRAEYAAVRQGRTTTEATDDHGQGRQATELRKGDASGNG
jgi:hypothetical protein